VFGIHILQVHITDALAVSAAELNGINAGEGFYKYN
jgi:hypothetical protein